MTIDEVEQLLVFRYNGRTATHDINFNGAHIGSMVSYGSARGTVYGSRIYGDAVSIEESAGSPRVLRKKVARKIAAAMRAKTW